MATGKIKQIPNENEPGVIQSPLGEYAFTMEDVLVDLDSLKIGQEVQFRSEFSPENEKMAVEITLVGQASQKHPSQDTKPPKTQAIQKPRDSASQGVPKQQVAPPLDAQVDKSTQPKQTTASQTPTNLPAYSKAQPEPQDGFVNPYNFVPLGEKAPTREKPESHEYFIGKSGQITCKLSLKTPFFTPHPERQWQVPKDSNLSSAPSWIDESVQALIGNAEEHDVLGLLRDYNGNPFIPGASLKGAFRSVAEALSNSCLSIIDFQWELREKSNDVEVKVSRAENYYSSRQVQSPPFVGIVTKLASPTESGAIEVSSETDILRKGKKVGQRSEQGKIFFRKPAHMPAKVKIFGDELSKYKDGDRVIAMCKTFTQTIEVKGRRIYIPILTVQNLRTDKGEELQSDEKRGIIRIADVTDEKKSHRFIFWPEEPDEPREAYFSWRAQLEYNRTLKDSIKEDQDLKKEQFDLKIEIEENKQKKTKAIGTRFQRHELAEKDIVYFNASKENQVRDMGPVELYRVLYKHSLDAVLLRKHQDFLTCDKPDNLCPCCRIFGWVPPTGEEETSTASRKGFVHFSTAILNQELEEITTQWVTLKPLGKPHPSCWQFYLNAEDSGTNAGYNDDNATILGRKFYWHQPDVKINSKNPTDNIVADRRKDKDGNPQSPDNQNKTVELLLPKTKQGGEVSFKFTVNFENLSDAELGLLLLTLQPNLLDKGNIPSEQLYHHIGMGKPLGLGSVEVEITEIDLINRAKRYQSLTDDGKDECHRDAMIDAFVARALSNQSKPSGQEDARLHFAAMPHIEPLLIMLDFSDTRKSVKYPLGAKYPDMKDYWESFNWFTDRAQRDVNRTKRHMLLTPREIVGYEGGIRKNQDGFPPKRRPVPQN